MTKKKDPALEVLLTEEQELQKAYDDAFKEAFKAEKKDILDEKKEELIEKAKQDAIRKARSKGWLVDTVENLQKMFK